MSEAKIKAAMWMAGGALYMMSAEILRQMLGINMGAIFMLVLGIIGAAGCFQEGRRYERERQAAIETTCDAWVEAGGRQNRRGTKEREIAHESSEANRGRRGGARERTQFLPKGGNGDERTLRRRGCGAVLDEDGSDEEAKM